MNRILVVLLVVAAVLVGLLLISLTSPQVEALRVDEARGGVSRLRGDEEVAAELGTTLVAGDRLSTDPGAQAVIGRPGLAPIRVGGGTTVRLRSIDDDGVGLELEIGQVRARVRPGQGALAVTNAGRTAVATDAALSVSVDGDGLFAVDVEEGDVAIEGVPGVSAVSAGQRLLSSRDGVARRLDVPVAPLLDVQWPPVTREPVVQVAGVVEPFASVRRVDPDGAPVRADADGRFLLAVPLAEGPQRLVLEVTDALGRTRRAEAEVRRDTTAPTFKIRFERGR